MRFPSLSLVYICASLLLINNAATGYNECDDRSEDDKCFSYKRFYDKDISLRVQKELGDFSKSGLCPSNDTSQYFGLCEGNDFIDAFANFSQFRRSHCFCDADCHYYHDCCIDEVKHHDIINANKWTCLTYSMPEVSFYVKQRCPSTWTDTHIRTLCEKEAWMLKQAGVYHSHLQAIPVHSWKTEVVYRNVYCAMCNDDVTLTKWDTYIHCSGEMDFLRFFVSIHNSDHIDPTDILANGTYNPQKNYWRVNIGNKQKICRLMIKEFYNLSSLSENYNIRLCKPAVDSCSLNADSLAEEKCKSYTSYIYKNNASKRTKYAYKNFHCALCNGMTTNELTCRDLTAIVLYADAEFDLTKKTTLPLLFDFNFIGEAGNQVGLQQNCALENGQIWDFLLKMCLNVTCGKLRKKENDICVPLNREGNQTFISENNSCLKVILNSNLFYTMENKSIYVNYSGKLYTAEQYEVYKSVNGVVQEILVCAETEIHFEFDVIQVWLSQLTLSVSIICLILHLSVYCLLPKLRNSPGKILMSLSGSLLGAHLFFLLESDFRKILWLCYCNAVLMHFGYLSAFFWMSVMAFDIFRTFSSKGTRSGSGPNTFKRYSLYAWTGPVLIVTLAILIDNFIHKNTFAPKYGESICWFNSKKGLFVFFAIPVTFLLSANLVLFTITALNIRTVTNQAKSVSQYSDKMRYYLYIKLAVVFGLTWLFGFLAAILRMRNLWYPFIILNGLQGALIFIVFTVKKKVFHMLVVRLKLRSHKYKLSKDVAYRNALYSSLSNLTTLTTSLHSSVVPVLSGRPDMLKRVKPLNPDANISEHL